MLLDNLFSLYKIEELATICINMEHDHDREIVASYAKNKFGFKKFLNVLTSIAGGNNEIKVD